MKLKFKPWQIGLIAAACIVVLGGAGVGIYFGVNHAIDSAVDEKLNSALETMTDTSAEPALDETGAETPTQTPGETDSSAPADPSQPKREPETVTVYVTAEPDKPETSTKPETQTETERETEPQVELVYDEQLTKEVSELLGTRYPKDWTDGIYKDDGVLENALKTLIQNGVYSSNSEYVFIKKTTTPSVQSIVKYWTYVHKHMAIELRVYKTSNDLIFAFMYI